MLYQFFLIFAVNKALQMIELRVNELLKEKKMTMAELAKEIGINRVNLYNSLNGNPTYSRLKEVADVLGVEISELFKKNTEGVSVYGYIEIDGEIYKVSSLKDIKNLVATIEEAIEMYKKEEKEDSQGE